LVNDFGLPRFTNIYLNKECFKKSGVKCTCDFVLWLFLLEVLFSIIVIRNGKWHY